MSATTLRALLALLVFPAAVATADMNDPSDYAEEMAVVLMQSRHSLIESTQKVMRREAAAVPEAPVDEAFDSTAFAQTGLEVSTGELEGARPRAGETVQPAWVVDEQDTAAPLSQESMCSAEGLTPGVCAMAALARGPPPSAAASVAGAPSGSGNGTAAELNFFDSDHLERALFQEIEAALAGKHTGFSLGAVEEALSGFFASLPKNEAGRLDHATVRYALHQHFLRKHSWYIRSLNPVGEAQTPASPGEALRAQVPLHLQTLIEKKQDGRGLGLHELAALVATLDHLIQGDMGERLKAAYEAHGQQPWRSASRLDVADVLKTYMAHFLSEKQKSGYAFTPEEARHERAVVEAGYGGWHHVADMIDEAVRQHAPENPWMFITFSEAMSIAQEVLGKFEAISSQDCQDMKRDLTKMPNGASGEVLLADLHRKALEGSMLFSESSEYLATLGALSDSARGVGVLVPNYIYSPSNCLGTTSFFEMCCPNECEVLMQKLESRLRKPEASPAEAYSILNSLTEYSLSEEALADLDVLAHLHEGKLAIHGHDFALWLHWTFPRECPRPREEDYAGARTGAEVPAAKEEYQAVAKLPFVAASRSELMQELVEDELATDSEDQEEDQPTQDTVAPKVNASGAWGVADTTAEQLKAIAAKKLAAGGLKLASSLDAASLAQTRLDVSRSDGQGSASEAAEERSRSGLNVRRLP